MSNESGTNLLWFLAGLGVGTVVGLTLAPASGIRTRRYITSKAEDAGHYLTSSGRDYIDRGRELYERGRLLADEAAEMFNEGQRLMERSESYKT